MTLGHRPAPCTRLPECHHFVRNGTWGAGGPLWLPNGRSPRSGEVPGQQARLVAQALGGGVLAVGGVAVCLTGVLGELGPQDRLSSPAVSGRRAASAAPRPARAPAMCALVAGGAA